MYSLPEYIVLKRTREYNSGSLMSFASGQTGHKLPTNSILHPRRVNISTTQRYHTEIIYIYIYIHIHIYIYNPTYVVCDTPRMIYIEFYIFRHRGDIIHESVSQRYTSQHDNLRTAPFQEVPAKPWLRNHQGHFYSSLEKSFLKRKWIKTPHCYGKWLGWILFKDQAVCLLNSRPYVNQTL